MNKMAKRFPRVIGTKNDVWVDHPRKLSQIERTTAFIIAVMEINKSQGVIVNGKLIQIGLGIGIEANCGRGIGIEKKADRYHAIAVKNGRVVRVELDKEMYEAYLSGGKFPRYELNLESYQ